MSMYQLRKLGGDGHVPVPAAVDEEGIREALRRLVHRDNQTLDALACAELLCSRRSDGDEARPGSLILQELQRLGADISVSALADMVAEFIAEIGETSVELTGAEAVAVILEQHGVSTVFAYAGTSELALCDAADRAVGLSLVNGRGDKECVFMAAGASLLRPNNGIAILHGARGLTNATGGIAATRRNEVGTLFIVGLPSTGSARFLPPHGEKGLIASIGNFVDRSWEVPPVPEDAASRLDSATEFVRKLRFALTGSAVLPARPSMFGIPQDVAETRWVPLSVIRAPWPALRPRLASATAVNRAVDAICAASRPLFLIDDYGLRYPRLRETLAALTELLGAPALQLRYRRGPMLFERLRREEVGNFVGWFNQFSAAHNDLFNGCDVCITIEDRNLYRRVAGPLPSCRKIAINGDRSKVLKNEYLGYGDILVEGNVTEILQMLVDELTQRNVVREPWFTFPAETAARVTPEPASDAVEDMRTEIARAIAQILSTWDHPVLVDDSQMFGGLISERYDLLPPGLRVFGDHGGFVGGGLASATGIAISEPHCRVLCTLGDQGFINSLQGLISAAQEKARVLFLVCNNGAAVSLKKQAAASGPEWFGRGTRPYLDNVPGLSYRRIAEAFGIQSWFVEVGPDPDAAAVQRAVGDLRIALLEAGAVRGPSLVDLKLPSDSDTWRGIWLTAGFEEMTRAGNSVNKLNARTAGN